MQDMGISTSPNEAHSAEFNHINGSNEDLLDRLAVSELCKGWPVYRDASEWMNFRSLFTNDAVVWTTWSGPRTVDEFIDISKAGKVSGAFIQHRECGTLVELNRPQSRAIGKMKATITQRFVSPEGVEYDVDCDCRFIFFCVRTNESDNSSDLGFDKPEALPHSRSESAWKAQFVKLVYEKDRLVPVDGRTVPSFSREALEKYPVGYQYLGAAQAQLGYKIDGELVTLRDTAMRERMYDSMEKWLAGENPQLF